MCGIFGFVSSRQREASVVFEALRELEYRGYDSWGIAVDTGGRLAVEKHVGPISRATAALPAGRAALGHTRWATHGGVTDANAHPHLDCSGRFALIHNGIVENHRELAARLGSGHCFRSQTDTEVLVHSLEERAGDVDLLPALLAVIRDVQGLSAVAVLDVCTGQIVAAKNGSPLAVGWGDDGIYLSSDPAALGTHAREVAFLEDGHAVALGDRGAAAFDIATGLPVTLTRNRVECEAQRGTLAGYRDYMTKEIHEQPEALRRIAHDPGPAALGQLFEQAREIVLTGCGTAYHAALSGRAYLAAAGRAAHVAMASEMPALEPILDADTLVVALSQSGETIDVLEAVRAARAAGARVASVVNVPGSTLDRLCDVSVHLACGPEKCVLATKSYTGKLAVLQIAAGCAAGRESETRAAVAASADAIETVLRQEASDRAIRRAAERIAEDQHLFILGRGQCYPAALETALKIKEVSYLHAEGFPSGELKHGVIALVTNGTPCIILAPDGPGRKEALAAAAEVRARGAFTIGVSPCDEPEFDLTLRAGKESTALFEIAATAQLLAYNLAILRGCDPDKPRNLAKSVTVK
ncbi:MAG TPA: glutamine--fructose-6-phosphate transaminase (isomerizing) [Chloroflexota bacterium]|nr:glutamine--fructose-6-phosphate transaminase (isomerizing) [Chloroflexota bacterium]